MPLLDRTVLHKETLRQAAEQLAAKPKAEKPWKLLQDGYAFDLQQRPPTTALDLLTSYLEIRYADVLLQKDAAQTLNRQLALHNLQSRGGLSTELLEQPPAALTAAKTLSAAEREAVCKTLDGLLGSRQFVQYRDAVLQLYGDGLISWGELQECWGAATAGEELAAAAEAPVSFAADRQQLFKVLAGQQQLPNDALRFGGNSSSSSSSSADSAAASAARRAWEEAGQQLQASWSSGRAPPPAATTAAAAAPSTAGTDAWWDNGPISYEEAEQTWQQLLHLAGQTDGPRFDQVLTAGSDGVQQQLQVLQRSLQRAVGLGEEHVQALTGLGSSTAAIGAADLQQQLQQVLAAPPSLEQLLQQHWEQVSQQELGRDLQQGQPTWSQLWRLLEQVASHQQLQAQEQQAAAVEAPLGGDASGEFERFLREADAVPLTPPPYPGARRLLRWEQRLMLHAVSGQVVLPAELKVKLAVSAAELQQETGLSDAALQYMLAVAGSRYNASTGDLTIACDRFPTREENRRWCLEVLHRLLQAAQAKFPSDRFWVDSNAVGVASSDLVAAGAQP